MDRRGALAVPIVVALTVGLGACGEERKDDRQRRKVVTKTVTVEEGSDKAVKAAKRAGGGRLEKELERRGELPGGAGGDLPTDRAIPPGAFLPPGTSIPPGASLPPGAALPPGTPLPPGAEAGLPQGLSRSEIRKATQQAIEAEIPKNIKVKVDAGKGFSVRGVCRGARRACNRIENAIP